MQLTFSHGAYSLLMRFCRQNLEVILLLLMYLSILGIAGRLVVFWSVPVCLARMMKLGIRVRVRLFLTRVLWSLAFLIEGVMNLPRFCWPSLSFFCWTSSIFCQDQNLTRLWNLRYLSFSLHPWEKVVPKTPWIKSWFFFWGVSCLRR